MAIFVEKRERIARTVVHMISAISQINITSFHLHMTEEIITSNENKCQYQIIENGLSLFTCFQAAPRISEENLDRRARRKILWRQMVKQINVPQISF